MKNKLLAGLSSLLFSAGAYALPSNPGGYQRSYLRASINAGQAPRLSGRTPSFETPRSVVTAVSQLDILVGETVRELVIIDAAVPEKGVFYQGMKPGVEVVELSASDDGLVQLKHVLSGYRNLRAVHIVSHAQAGVLQLGNSRIDAAIVDRDLETFAVINGAIQRNGDLLFYGCDLAAGENGDQFLDILAANTHADIAASNDLTGNGAHGGDWELEIHKGRIETQQPFSEKALRDFSSVLLDQTITMGGFATGFSEPKTATYGSYTARLSLNDGDPDANSLNCYAYYGNSRCIVDYSGISTGDKKLYFDFTGGEQFNVASFKLYSGYLQNFRISSDKGDTTDVALDSVDGIYTATLNWTGITRLTIEKVDGTDMSYTRIDDIVLTNISPPPPPAITSATYDASAGSLAVTGSGFFALSGATNDIVANKFTFTGEGGATYTLTDTSNVEITSGTSFTLILSATDKAALNQIVNKNGTSSTSGTTFNVAAAEDWAAGADAAVVVADTTGNGVTVSNVGVPAITSATYDANAGTLVITGTGFLSLSGATNDIVANKFTLTGEGGATYTLTDTSNVEITSGTSFTLILSATDKAAINQIINKSGTSSTSGTTYNLAAAEDWAAGADAAVVVADTTGNGLTASNIGVPAITSATYDASTGTLVVTGTNFLSLSGATNDIVANKFTLLGEGGATYTLTDTSNVEITSSTSFTVTLSATDRAAVNQIINKNGTSSTGATTYGVSLAEDWAAGADAAVSVADTTGNGITVSNIAVPAITSATYDASTGAVVITGTGFLSLSGATNDIVANKFTLTGEGGSTSTLTDTANVELTSGTSFTLTLSATDRVAINQIVNKNGTSSTSGTTYNLSAAEDWAAGANAAVAVADTTGNGVTVSNVAVPAITSATYDASTGAVVITGTGFLSLSGATNDIVANKFTLTGEGGSTSTLTDTANVELTSGTSFTLTLSATDKAAINQIVNKNGTSSTSGTTYNLSAAEDWAAGANAAVAVADTTGNGVTVSNVAVPAITSATYDASTGAVVVTGTGFLSAAGATNDIVANKFTLTGEGGTTYTLTDTSNVEITSGTSFSVFLSATDKAAINQIINKNGTSSTSATTYNLSAAEDWAAGTDTTIVVADTTGNGLTASNIGVPAITSATYDANTGTLVLTGTNFLSLNGATNDIVANKFTLTGEGGATYTLTDTANVEITSSTSFTLTLSATDRAAVNQIINKNGTSSTGATTYGVAVAEDWAAGADAAVVVADTTGNGITVSNIAVPAITSATYNASTGAVVVTGTGFLSLNGATNDIVANKFTLTGEGGSTYTLTDTANVELTSGTSFTLTLSATDRAAINQIVNKNGTSSTTGTTYNLSAAEDWAAGANAAVVVADTAANRITASNVATPAVSSATYDGSTGTLVVTGTNFLSLNGATNDIVANKFTLTGEGGATYTLTNTSNVEITSGTAFSLALSSTDRSGVDPLLNKAGTSSNSGTTYNLAAAEDWAAGADAAMVVADTTGNGVTVSNPADITPPQVTSVSVPSNATYKTGQNLDFTINFSEAVTVDTGGGTPRIALTLDTDGTVYADYISGSGTSALVFRYTIATSVGDENGIVVGSLSANGGTLRDAAGNNATLTLNSVGNTAGVLVDAVAPSIVSIVRVTSATTNATSIVYTVTFAENVTGVDVSDFTLTATGTASGTISSVTQVNGSTYTVTITGITGNGTLRLDLNNAGTGIADTPDNAINAGFTSGQSYTIDQVAPVVSSIERQTPTGLHVGAATAITYRATFDSSVSGVDASAFTLTTVTGNAVGSIASVTAVTASSYDIVVNALAGVGTLRLDVKASGTTIIDAAVNPLAGGFTTGDVYAVGATGVFDATALNAPSTAVISTQPGDQIAQRFTTGANAPLTVTDVAIRVVSITHAPKPVVTINRDNSGVVGSVVTTLTNPASLTASALNVWTGRVTLDPAITYWIIFSDASATGSYIVNYSSATTGGSGAWLTAGDYSFQYYGAHAGAVPLEIGATTAASITGVTPPVNDDYHSGQNLDFTVNFAEAVTVTGAPTLGFTVGSTARSAVYLSGSGTSVLVFRYTVQPADADADGIALDPALTLNGGTIQDANMTGVSLGFTPPVTTGVRVGTAEPAITSALTAAAVYGDAFDYTITASSVVPITSYTATGLPTGLSLAPSTGVISGIPTQSGDFSVVLGATNAAGAGNATLVIIVARAAATVTLGNLDQIYDGAERAVTVTTTPGGLAVALNYDGSATAPTNAGSYPVTATITDANYAGSASGTLAVAKADQTVSFVPVGSVSPGTPIALNATASSGLSVTFGVISGNATLVGSTLTILDTDPVIVRATQAGDANYNPATSDQTIDQAVKQAQTITFAALTDRAANATPFALDATATSGLPVTFALVSGPALLSGPTVTLSGASGTVTISASQSGDDIYAAAAVVTQSFNVTAVGPQIFFGTITGAPDAALLTRSASGARISAATVADTIAATISQDNTHGTIIGYLQGLSQGFVVDFALNGGGSFEAPATIVSNQVPPAAPALTFRGQVLGGVLSGTIIEFGATFSAKIDPPTGPTSNVAGYYAAAATNTATGSTYSIVGTNGEVFVLVVTPEFVTSGTGTITASGTVAVTTDSSATFAGQIDPVSTTISSTLTTSDNTIVNFSGVKTSTARTDRLINLSSRGAVSPGTPLIAGFVIGGAENKQILLRAVGPGLSGLGVAQPLPQPKLHLFNRQGQVIQENDNWSGDDITSTSNRVGAFALAPGSGDAALLATLSPGVYTMHALSGDGSSGVALVEIYDASTNPQAEYQRLINISSRSTVGSGENVLISGFVITGNAPKRVLIRGIGPTMVEQGVTAVVTDPVLRVYDRAQTAIAFNNDWGTPVSIAMGQISATGPEIAEANRQVGAFTLPPSSKDAAIIVTLEPGIYTVVLSDGASAGGSAMIEVYELP